MHHHVLGATFLFSESTVWAGSFFAVVDATSILVPEIDETIRVSEFLTLFLLAFQNLQPFLLRLVGDQDRQNAILETGDQSNTSVQIAENDFAP